MADTSGWLWKLGAKGVVKGWKKRWCSLLGPRIRYYKQKNDSEFQGFIDLTLATGVTQNSLKKTSQAAFTFEIVTPDRVWYLGADSEAERSRWIEAIERATSELKNKTSFSRSTPTLASTAPLSSSPQRQTPVPPPTSTNRAVPVPPTTAAASGPAPVPPPKPAPSKFRPELPKRGKSADITTSLITPLDRGSAQQLQMNRVNALRGQPAKPSSQPTSPVSSPPISPRGSTADIPAPVEPTLRSESTNDASLAGTGRRMRRSLSAPHLIEQMSADEAAKVAAKREAVAKEILQTEKSYIECLQIVLNHYMMPMLAATRNKTQQVIFTDDDIKTIFSGNLTLMVGVNMELVKSLEARVASWSETQKVGDVFCSIAPFLKMYFDYGANYESALATFGKLSKDPTFVQLMQQYRSNSGKNLALDHLLIMPIQRIPRYTLLLGELLKSTEPNHPDYEDLKKAIKSLEDTTMHINENMKRSDAINKVVVSGLEDFVAPHRILMFDGNVDVRVNNKTKQEMRFIIFNDLVVHLPRSKGRDRAALANPENQSSIVTAWIKPCVTAPNAFDIFVPKKQYTLEQKTQEEKDLAHQLQSALSKYFGEVPVERKWMHTFCEGITYDGSWFDGHMEGFGVMHQIHCGVYEGSWSRGERAGHGKQIWLNGAMYEGQWKSNQPHGRGLMTWPTGESYNGEFDNGARSGHGEFKYANGDTYVGEFYQDRPHGTGTLLSVSGRYDGSWVSGVFHGDGNFVDAAGREYSGGWINGLMEGQGEMKYNANTVYSGKWKEGRRHGKGLLKQSAPNGTKLVYQGDWENDLKQGQGQMTYYDGSMYEGQWKDDKRHGSGRLGFRNNDSCGRVLYEGDWQHDRMTGRGVLTFSSGERYEGFFKDGHYSGPGVYTYPDGRRLEGKWNAGTLDGKVNYATDPKVDGQQHKKLTGQVITGQQTNNSFLPASRAWPDFHILLPGQIPQITLPYLN